MEQDGLWDGGILGIQDSTSWFTQAEDLSWLDRFQPGLADSIPDFNPSEAESVDSVSALSSSMSSCDSGFFERETCW